MRGHRQPAVFIQAALLRGLPSLGRAIALGFIVVGGSVVAALPEALDQPYLVAAILFGAVLYTFGQGAYRLNQDVAGLLTRREMQLEAFETATPRLSFGRAVIPNHSQPIHVLVPAMGGLRKGIGTGRIIRVPVVNAPGAGETKQVHARLTFLPDDLHREFAPREPAQGEWFSEHGPEIEIDLPGNGRPRMLDVLLVLDRDYPHAHEWTIHSRNAALRGYTISANPVTIDIEVMGSGAGFLSAYLKDRLEIRLDYGHMIRADWARRGQDEATNWVAWSKRPSR